MKITSQDESKNKIKPKNAFWRNNQSNYYPNIIWAISGKEDCMTFFIKDKIVAFADYSCSGHQQNICVTSK